MNTNDKVCTNGHPMGEDEQDCSQCGSPVATTPIAAITTPPPPAAPPVAGAPLKCGNCKKPMDADATFCEHCGADRSTAIDPTSPTGAAPVPIGHWICTLTINPERWQKLIPDQPVPAPRDFLLQGPKLSVGRYSSDRGALADVDLGDDIAVSRHHADLEQQADGSYAICLLKDPYPSRLDDERLEIGKTKPIRNGSKIVLGEYSALTFAFR